MVVEPGPAFVGHALGSHLRLFIRPPAGLDEGAVAGSAASAWAAVEAEFEAVDLALSRFRGDSELTALNRMAGTDQVVEVSWRLRTAVATMHRATRMTDGRFDPSVLGALEAIGEHGADVPAPRDEDEDKPTASPRGPSVAALERPRPIRTPLQPLDTGGIGKGLALRWAARRALERMPIGTALLLDAGGDVLAAGRRCRQRVASGRRRPARPRCRRRSDCRCRRGGRGDRHVVRASPELAWPRRQAGPPPHRSGDASSGEDRSARGDGRRSRPRMGRGLDEGPVSHRQPGDPGRGSRARAGRMVDRRRWPTGHDAGGASPEHVGGGGTPCVG